LDLWHKRELPALVARAAEAKAALPKRERSKKAKVAKRATALLRHSQFVRAAGLADSKGIANATQDTLDAIPDLFKAPGVIPQETLRRLYGPKIVPTHAGTSVTITTEDVQKCLMAEVAPLTTPHKDGWRAEHLSALCKDPDCATSFTTITSALAAGDVTDRTCDIVSSATLVILLEKTEDEMEEMKRKQGPNYTQPQRPPGMGSTITKVAANCILARVEPTVAASTRAHQFAVNAKGGCNMIK
jgi:hypothetical protein